MDIGQLENVFLFNGTDGRVLRRLASEHQIEFKPYEKGATVHRQHDRCVAMDAVVSGSLVAYALAENGSAVTMFEFREGALIGANLLFGDANVYPLNIYAVTACALIRVTKSAVEELLRGYDFTIRYVRALSANPQGMNQRIQILTQKTLRDNLMDYFLQQTRLQGRRDIRLPVSKKQLADQMGVQRPSLFRELKKMKDDGLIDVKNRLIRVMK